MGMHLQVVGSAGNRGKCVDEGEMGHCEEVGDEECSRYHHPKIHFPFSVSA
jgi:hypothetical protein